MQDNRKYLEGTLQDIDTMLGPQKGPSIAEQFVANAPPQPDMGAYAARVGLPVGMALAAPGMGPVALAATAAGGSLLSNQLEEGAHVPTLGEAGEASVAAVTSYAGSRILPPVLSAMGKVVTKPLAWIANKIFLPKDFYSDVTNIPNRNLYEVLKQLGSSPTPGQVLDNDVIQFIEGISRGGNFGKGSVLKLDKNNMQLITDKALDYIDAHARLGWQANPFDSNGMLTQMSKSRFGQLAEAVLNGKLNMARIINARNYENFRSSIQGKGIQVDMNKIEDVFLKNADNKFMQDVYKSVEQWVKPGQGTTTVDAEKAYEAYKQLNTYFRGNTPKGEKWAAGQLKEALEEPFKKSLPPDSLKALESANETFGKFATNLDNKLINRLKDKFDEFPSTAIQTIEGAEKKYDTLLAIKKAYQTNSTGEATGSLMAYNRNIIEPMRYNVIQKSFVTDANIAKPIPGTGQLDGKKLLTNLDVLGKEAGEEIFGGAAGLKEVYNLGSAVKRLAESQASNQRSMYIKIAQGSTLAGLGVYGASQDDPRAYYAAAGVFITPMVMAKYITGNPAATRALIEGITGAINTKPHNLALAQLMVLSGKEKVDELSEGLKSIYYGNELAKIAPKSDGSIEQNLHFIPQSILEENALKTDTGKTDWSALGAGNM